MILSLTTHSVRWSAAGPIERTKEFRASVEKAASQIKALFSL